jgi:hypothetical protein
VDQIERGEGAWPSSPMMADGGGTWTGTGAEEGSPVAGAGEADT